MKNSFSFNCAPDASPLYRWRANNGVDAWLLAEVVEEITGQHPGVIVREIRDCEIGLSGPHSSGALRVLFEVIVDEGGPQLKFEQDTWYQAQKADGAA